MKRYISFFCVSLIFVMALIQPVSAAELGSVGAVDLLGLGYIEVNGSNVENMRVNLSVARSGSIWFPLEVPFGLGQFELLVMTSDPSLTFKRSDNAVTYEKFESGLGENYYVVRGNFSGRGKTLNYTSSGSSSGDYFFIVSAKVMPLNYEIVEIPFNFQVFDAGNGYQMVDALNVYRYEFWDEPYYDEFDDMYARQIRIYPDKNDLAGLDYFDLDIYLQNLEIESVSASFGGNALDVSYTEQFIGDGIFNDPIEDGAYDKDKTYGLYKVVLRVDVSGINLLEGSPTVFINYNANNYGNMQPYVYVYGINAGKFWNSTDSNTTYLFRIWNKLTSGFASVVSAIGTCANNIITSIGNAASTIVSSMDSNFDTYFSKVGIWFSNQNTLIQNKINDLHSMINREFDALEAAIRGDTAPGDSFQEEVEDKDQQFKDMAAIMESVDQPDLNSVNVSADTYVDSTVLASSMSGLTSVIGGPLFFDMFVMSIMMCTAGYVLFGKR